MSRAPARPSGTPLPYRAARAAYRLVKPFVSFHLIKLILRADLADAIVAWPARAPIRISVASPQDVEQALDLRLREAGEDLRDLYSSRLQRGQTCFVAKIGPRVVGMNWLATGSEVENDAMIVLREREVWCLDAYTAADWRGHAIHSALLCAMLDRARALGHEIAYTQVGVWNRRSWKSHQRLGWRISGAYLILSLPRLGVRRALWFYGTRHPIAGFLEPSPLPSEDRP